MNTALRDAITTGFKDKFAVQVVGEATKALYNVPGFAEQPSKISELRSVFAKNETLAAMFLSLGNNERMKAWSVCMTHVALLPFTTTATFLR